MTQWYLRPDGSNRTHRMPFRCDECRVNHRGGHVLPFRKLIKTRWLDRQLTKPLFFKWRLFHNFWYEMNDE